MLKSIEEYLAHSSFLIIGHRGAPFLAPENTMRSFEAALGCGCRMIELDVFACKGSRGDQQLLVIHDDKLHRTTNGRGRVMEHTVEQLRALDAGDGQRIPLLDEVVQLLTLHNRQQPHGAALNIELKGPDTAEPVADALERMAEIPLLISSFNHNELQRFHALADSYATAPLYDRYSENWHATASGLHATAINISLRMASPARIQVMRRAGYEVFVYTVNSVTQAQVLKAAGASGVFTDRPDLLMHLAA